MVQNSTKHRRLLQLAGIAVVAGLLLVTGALIGSAMADDGAPAADPPALDGDDDANSSQPEGNTGDGEESP